jgi:hypothetical protein
VLAHRIGPPPSVHFASSPGDTIVLDRHWAGYVEPVEPKRWK